MEMVSIATRDLKFGDEIGNGNEGSVYKGECRFVKNSIEEIRTVAIKKLLKCTNLSELKTLFGLSHPNIINVFGFVEEPHELCIVMELCQYSLRGYFERNPSPLSDEHLLRWSLEAALPLEYLRKHKILHRDVKPDNYVVDSDMVLKLTDFGVARDLDCTVSKFTQVGTWRWMAPEVHGVEDNKLLLSPLYDIFSLGLVLWYLVARKIPYSKSNNNFAIAQAITKGERPIVPAECPVKLAELIQHCWSGDRKDRPDISQVIISIKDVISSLETTGTLLRIVDMASVETTLTIAHNGRPMIRYQPVPLIKPVSEANPTDKKMPDTNQVAVVKTPDNANLGAAQPLTNFSPTVSLCQVTYNKHTPFPNQEASGPLKTQAISSSQADVITKTKSKPKDDAEDLILHNYYKHFPGYHVEYYVSDDDYDDESYEKDDDENSYNNDDDDDDDNDDDNNYDNDDGNEDDNEDDDDDRDNNYDVDWRDHTPNDTDYMQDDDKDFENAASSNDNDDDYNDDDIDDNDDVKEDDYEVHTSNDDDEEDQRSSSLSLSRIVDDYNGEDSSVSRSDVGSNDSDEDLQNSDYNIDHEKEVDIVQRASHAEPKRIKLGEQTEQDLSELKNAQQVSIHINTDSHTVGEASAIATLQESPKKVTLPSSGPLFPHQEVSKKEEDLTLQVSATDKPQTQNIYEKRKDQNKVIDKEKVQEVCLEDVPQNPQSKYMETKIGEQKRRSSSPVVIKPNKLIRQDSPVISESEMVTKST